MFKRIMFMYYWTKGEKAMKNGDYALGNECKRKLQKLRKIKY